MRSFVFAAYVKHISADTISVFEFFPRDNFITAENGFGFTNINDHISEFNTFNGAVDNGADFFFIFFVLAVALSITNFLYNDLLCGLGSNTTEINRGKLVNNVFTDFDVFINGLGIFEQNLSVFAVFFQLFNNFAVTSQIDCAGFAVNGGSDVVFKTVTGTSGFLNSNFHCGEDIFFINIFLSSYSICNQDNFWSGHIFDIFHFSLGKN